MDRADLEVMTAAAAQGVNVHKNADGMWVVGLTPALGPLTPSKPVTAAAAILGGGLIRLENGRTLKMEMTDAEAREEFGLEPKAR